MLNVAYTKECNKCYEKWEKIYMQVMDIECIHTYLNVVDMMEKWITRNRREISVESPSRKYCKLLKVQAKVVAHVRQWYQIHYDEEKCTREDKEKYHYILRDSKKCDYPPMTELNSFEDLKSDDDDIFLLEDEDEAYQVNNLFAI